MTTKLFERLVTKFSIKANDLAKYLDISKATIYNYRNLKTLMIFQVIKSIKYYIYLEKKQNQN